MRELNFVMRLPDALIMLDLVHGLPMVGWARHSPTLFQKQSEAPLPSMSAAELARQNKFMMTKVEPTGDAELDEAGWLETKAEFDNGTLLGPFDSTADIPVKNVQLLPRFSIRERNGRIHWKVRMVDDCTVGKQNASAGTSAAHRPADLDYWVVLLRAVAVEWPERLSAFTLDFKAAYRQLAARPHQAHQFGVATWDAERGVPVYGLALSQMFGSSMAPINFSRYPEWRATLMGIMFGVVFAQCVDVLLCPERKRFITSAYRCWRRVAELCGWDIQDEKSPPPKPRPPNTRCDDRLEGLSGIPNPAAGGAGAGERDWSAAARGLRPEVPEPCPGRQDLWPLASLQWAVLREPKQVHD